MEKLKIWLWLYQNLLYIYSTNVISTLPASTTDEKILLKKKKPPHKMHIWFFADTKANTKKPKEHFFANARAKQENLSFKPNQKTKIELN